MIGGNKHTEAIIYIARKLHWTLEEIGKLSPQQFYNILWELQTQEAQEEYQKNFRVASILAAIYNTIPRKSGRVLKAEDFLISNKSEGQTATNLEKLAKEEGIIMPKGEG